jgi:GNAT superfamily N-acetyltransferase
LTYVGVLARLDQPSAAQMPKARLAQASDLAQLLDLFRVSEVSSIAQPPDRARRIWSQTPTRKGVAVFVLDAGGQIVATCMLITALNLLRSGRGHGFLENVVTRPEFRRQGHGRESFRLLSPTLGRGIVITYYFKVAERTVVPIDSMRVVASNRQFGPPTLRTAQHKFDFYFEAHSTFRRRDFRLGAQACAKSRTTPHPAAAIPRCAMIRHIIMSTG